MGNSSKTFGLSGNLYCTASKESQSVTGKLTIAVFLLFAICFFVLPAQAKYGGGTGEPNDPYLIYDANHINTISADANDWGKHFKLMADVNLGGDVGCQFSTIGSDYNPFGGVFDGNNHTISNLPARLFGRISGGQVKTLGLTNPNNTGEGSLAARLHEGTISDCYVEGGSGLVMYNEGTITKCYATGFCTGGTAIGGLVGENDEEGIISECYSKSGVFGFNCIGGLVGENAGVISNSYATGQVTKSATECVLFDGVGGLVGNNSGIIYNCYSTGRVSPKLDCVGGFVGYADKPYYPTASFWDIQTSGYTISRGGEGKTTAEMQTMSTFTDAGWDFVGETANGTQDIWNICERDDYPRLAWEEYGKYGGGSGTEGDPYLIYTSCQMNEIGADPCDWDKNFKLMADIDMGEFTGTEFNIIGTFPFDPFTGVFDGNGHTISNFTYSSSGTDRIGLFRCVAGVIKNLRLMDPNVDAGTGSIVGSLVGQSGFHSITGCYVEGGYISGNSIVGGLVGMNTSGTVTECSSSSSVSGVETVGGLAGYVSGYGSISNSYSRGTVSGANNVGGLVGRHEGSISNCYSSGKLSGTTYVGGLVGNDGGGFYKKCFWDSDVNPDVNGIGNATDSNVIGESTTNMQTESTFTSAGWDFVGETANGTEDIWTICEGHDYPRLSWVKYGGGSGTMKKPYLIYNPCQMNAIGTDPCDWDKYIKLMADIDLSGYVGEQFNIIGNPTTPFIGVFDGNGYKILNFTWASLDREKVGLFGCVGGGLIKNMGMENADVNAGSHDYIGMLTGQNISGTIADCYSKGSVQGEGFVGGLTGENRGLIANCYSAGNILGKYYIGGLAGENEDGIISKCYSTGIVTGGLRVGGLVGLLTSGTITNCYSTASFGDGLMYIGALVGENTSGTISNCYSTGHFVRDSYPSFYGGLVGANNGVIIDSFWDTETSGLSKMCGMGSGCDDTKGKTTSEMQTESTFTSAGWDFVDIWDICEETNYPKFLWQILIGDFLCPDGVNFFDFSFFAGRWSEDNCAASNDCDGTDLDKLGSVDINDLRIFADNWLAGL